MKRSHAFAAIVFAALVAHGTEYFVNCNVADDSGDGLSEATAKRTIQAAVNLARQEGDIVTVLPGVYDEGRTWNGGASNRISITAAPITLRSQNGRATRDSTFIVGAFDPDPQDGKSLGMGTNAVRCIYVASSGRGSVIEGFTIAGGASRYEDSGSSSKWQNYGGGVYVDGSNGYVVDCVVSNCVGTRGGGMCGGVAVRTLFRDNNASHNGPAARNASLYHCIVTHNTGDGILYGTSHVAVNCTITDNYSKPVNGNTATQLLSLYNCVIAQNRTSASAGCTSTVHDHNVLHPGVNYSSTTGNSGAAITNDCRYAAPGDVIFAAPPFGDFRPVAGSVIVGAGATANLDLIPEAYRYKDFNGREFTPSSESVQAGAIQEVFSPALPAVRFTSTECVNSTYPNRPNVRIDNYLPYMSNPYFHVTNWPVQVRLEPVLNPSGSFKHFFGFQSSGPDTMYRYAGLDGAHWLVPPPAGKADLVLTPKTTDRALYVNDSTGNDDNAGTSADAPKKTIQNAIDTANAAITYWVVYVAPGRYDSGTTNALGALNRVYFTGGSRANLVRLIATSGPDETFIVGAEDQTSEHSMKCGPNAVRCVVSDADNCSVCGFTLVGGRSSLKNGNDETADNMACYGGGYYTAKTYFQVEDCIITNCAAPRGAAGYGGIMRRTRAVDCTSTWSGAFRSGWASSCTFSKIRSTRGSGSDLVIGYYASTLNCTMYDDGKARPFDNNANQYNVNDIVYGFDTFYNINNTKFAGTWYDAMVSDAQAAGKTGIAKTTLKFADADGGDFRPYSVTAGTLVGSADAFEDYYRIATCGIDGVRTVYDSEGRPRSGAFMGTLPSAIVVARKSDTSGRHDGISNMGTNYVTAAEAATFTATGAGGRPFKGFLLNGQLVEGGTSLVVGLAGLADASINTVSPVYGDAGALIVIR